MYALMQNKSTNAGRARLANVIEANEQEIKNGTSETNLQTFVAIAQKWSSHVNSRYTEQLTTTQYMEVALDSVFTLSPSGHNPECFRLFEAVDAGSIPVLVKSDLYNTEKRQPCRDALYHWYDAPIVVLEAWEDLYPTVARLMEDKPALDEMQVKLRLWYDEYMKTVVREWEDFILGEYVKDVLAAAAIDTQ